MFNIFNIWNNFWQQDGDVPPQKMPLTEKESEEQVPPYPYPVHKIAIREGLELAYIDEGERDAEVLLLVHGMGGGIPVWGKNIPEFKKQYRCIALDLPGHGYSTRADFPYTIRFYTEVLISFMKKLGLRRVMLLGHSMGGQIAIMTALKAPALVDRLILLSPAGVEPYTSVEKQTLINIAAAIVASGNAFTHNRFNYLLGFCNNAEEAGDLARKMAFFKQDAAHFGKMMLRSIEAMLLESLNHALHKIEQPCLMLVGRDDKVSPYQYLRGQDYAQLIEREAKKLPNGKLIVFANCGHFAQYQKPKSFNKEVLNFLMETSFV